MDFKLTSNFKPTGDQPEAIRQLVEGLNEGQAHQTLLGVTGSGKTFTMANVIQEVQRPTLILSHNKTLVAQLYGEFKQFFPENAVEYFVSYYDYYQPEAYVSVSDTFIEKELSINSEIEKLRLSASSSLLSGRKDVIIVASVSCIYGVGNPAEFKNYIIRLKLGQQVSQRAFMFTLVESMYGRKENEFTRSSFRVRGDTVDIFPPYADFACRVTFFGDEVEELETFDPETGKRIESMEEMAIFPANLYLSPKDEFPKIIREIEDELYAQLQFFEQQGKLLEKQRLKERVTYDLEMIRELGYCNGIENYSRFMDRREPGTRPFCLMDYFRDDFLLFIDESHVTVPQVSGMYGGDRSRKLSLVEHGFRLPSALDNRPLNFHEFQDLVGQVVYVSATPADYEMEMCEGVFVEQVVRPTGLLDPPIDVRPSLNQIDDLLEEINNRTEVNERALVTTLTKRMAEELTKYLTNVGIRCRYIHSEVDTLDRVEIIRDLRLGEFDVLVGVNLLREGLDLPEVSLVAILDADKEGFLRNERSLTQIAGRAARNSNGLVIFYADRITDSMKRTMDETQRRREKQIAYNEKHNITPTTVLKSKEQIMQSSSVLEIKKKGEPQPYIEPNQASLVADPVLQKMSEEQFRRAIADTKEHMKKAAKDLNFIEAARLRDEMFEMERMMKERFPD